VLYAAFKQGSGADSFGVSAWIALFPLLVLQAALAAFGVGFWICALTVRYRDLAQVTGFLIQLWMYATPVIYPVSQIPEQWRWLAELNPATFLVEAARLMLLGRGTVDAGSLAISATVTLVLFISGLLAFKRAERTFIDTI
jgi:lipopolysaccharide transport system permease protein